VKKESAGVLPWRWHGAAFEVLLIHPGGPLWSRRDVAAWSIAKGGIEDGETPEEAARREFREETGWQVEGPLSSLGMITQRGGKRVYGYGTALEVDPDTLVSATFSMEWPPRSGKMVAFPEVDRAGWFVLSAARAALIPSQVPFLERAAQHAGAPIPW
jgi:predicted NUDIX family NTP pyrophosphohydrolase